MPRHEALYRKEGESSWQIDEEYQNPTIGSTIDNGYTVLDGATENHELAVRVYDDSGSLRGVRGPILWEPTTATLAVSTNAETNLSSDEATLNGELTDLGGASSADVFFQYRETGASTWIDTTKQSLSATGTFDETVTGLDPETEYEFRAAAEANGETDEGSILTFTTEAETALYQTDFAYSNGTSLDTIDSWQEIEGDWEVQSERVRALSPDGHKLAGIDVGSDSVLATTDMQFIDDSGNVNRALGVAVHVQDNDNFFMGTIARSGNVEIFERSGGSYSQRSGTSMNINLNTFYTLEIEADSSGIVFRVDGANEISYTDTLTATNTHGMRSFHDDGAIIAEFDNWKAEEL